MIDIMDLMALGEDDGLTLKKGKAITYKSGYQVATTGIETADIFEAYEAIQKYDGTCGVWYSKGIFYIDKSHRVSTKREALAVGRACKQISILKWSTMSLIYC